MPVENAVFGPYFMVGVGLFRISMDDLTVGNIDVSEQIEIEPENKFGIMRVWAHCMNYLLKYPL
ncbi:hypothetical protein ACFL6I_10480 [candidate division KSB1 bacterium]